MNSIRSNPYQLQPFQAEQVQHLGQAAGVQQQSVTPQQHHLPSSPHVNPNGMPSKVTVGYGSFFTGTLKSRLDAVTRLYLRSSLTPDANAPVTQRQDGIMSYLVNHRNEQGEHEILAVSVDVDRNRYLRGLVATRLSDQQVMLEARFDSKINHFATKLTESIRSRIAGQVQDTMLAKGPKWYWELASGEPLTMKRLSAENMQTLKSQVNLQSLKNFERDFVKSVIDEPLYLTHSTPTDSNVKRPDGTVGLLSRQALLQRGAEFNTENTSQQDIDMLANDDHVFFSLEAGDQPQKDSSRFGDKMFRFKFDQPKILQNATLHLVDPLTAIPPSAESRFPAIEDHENEDIAAEVIDNLNSRAYTPGEATFHGPHMKLGLALSIIETCRANMPEELSKEILQGESLNNVINGLLRPTVMVPKHFFDKPTDEADILIN
jgi:hypothetical protein